MENDGATGYCVAIAENVVLIPGTNCAQIRQKWSTTFGVIALLFALFWNGLILLAVIGMVLKPESMDHAQPGQWLLFVSFALVGLVLLYMALGHLLNQTTLLLEDSTLRVVTAPLPWPGTRIYQRKECHSFGFREHLDAESGPSYSVTVIDPAGRETTLLGGLATIDAAQRLRIYLSNFYKNS